jgi:hypothetical protein
LALSEASADSPSNRITLIYQKCLSCNIKKLKFATTRLSAAAAAAVVSAVFMREKTELFLPSFFTFF